ncbi:chromosome segregation protein SMC [Thalassobacter stenotrophicus]|uniref:chromosome segregation protein SMC n=1 Tax=Thalassobacter stenotrophicus TaxID=266809 RepID=UPI0022A96312|nr:chromosome segregation protein SMC [Thalassobacter stenotrophicus]UYP67142.1 chromosome segregation protein SMC [Thalassobacter stenotrophicus]
MRFARLRLNGFKSFVDPTDLVIADGLTGVVGPNGCGKSNLLEALRWVMGENRPTAMRGGGMEDVIFAGAATRSARNFAEVTLGMDNSERLAPAAFNGEENLDIIRRVTRDVGSAYKVNGKDVRARDVQMLFADASTGAHSPALVRQGQISELINAKPQKRRRVLEEAAGISGLYQRRHEAELKLKGAETNLTRVDDVLEQLAAQLQTLARQARQAARYREIGTSLRLAEGQLLYRRWREAEEARAKAEAQVRTLLTEAAQAESAVTRAASARTQAEDKLPPLREEEAVSAAVLQRVLVARDTLEAEETRALERIETLTGRIEQLAHDQAREETLNTDAGQTIERLDWEKTELEKADAGHAEALTTAQAAAHEAAEVLAERESDLSRLTEDMARLAARHQSATRLIGDSQSRVERLEAEAAKAQVAVTEAQATLDGAQAALAQAQTAQQAATLLAQQADDALSAAEAARAETQERESRARAARSEAEGEATTLRAEVTALTKLIARDSSEDEPLLDRLTVEPGFEAALGAALADDLRSSETEGDTGWARLPDYDAPQKLPAQIRSIAEHVKAPAVLTRRLEQIGVVDADEAPKLQHMLLPGQRLVSQDGDLWRWDGFRAASETAPSSAALRLQQINRLQALKRDLEEVEARADGTRAAHEALTERLKELTTADIAARDARRAADRAVADASRDVSRAESAQSIAESKLETGRLGVARFTDEGAEARTALTEAQAAQTALEPLDAARGAVEDIKLTVEAARLTMLQRRAASDELKREGDARTRRRQEVTKELSGWRHRLETATTRITDLTERRLKAEAELGEAQAVPEALAAQRAELSTQITAAETRKVASAEALSLGEAGLRTAAEAERTAERAASEAREARAAGQARLEAAAEAVEAAANRINEDLETTPKALLAQLEVDPVNMPTAAALEADVNRLRRQRDALGAVNLRAEEDAREVQTEHDELLAEKTDLEEAIKALRAGIAGLNKEGRERLLTAFETVNSNFSMLFTHLFGGGEARLALVESDDPLEAGLEIMCQPPGKKLSTLSLLSGGEQTLTALALIFAVFLANPAPICVLDEVDAPLDDANVTRFCDMLDEMTRRTNTRFLIITHHAVTMARMDRLFGVTMAEQGVSQLVSVDLKKAESLVA